MAEDLFPYVTVEGEVLMFNVSPDAFEKFGLKQGQTVITPNGIGTVVGIFDGNLYVHVDGEEGARCWPNGKSSEQLQQLGITPLNPESQKKRSLSEMQVPSNDSSTTNSNDNNNINSNNTNNNSNSAAVQHETKLKKIFGGRLDDAAIVDIFHGNDNDYDITYNMLVQLCLAMSSPATTTPPTATAMTAVSSTTEPFLYWNHPAFVHVRLYVCLFLSLRDIAACTAVCKDWKKFFEQDDLWRLLYRRHWHVDNSNLLSDEDIDGLYNNNNNNNNNYNYLTSCLNQHDGSANHSTLIEISWKKRYYLEKRMFEHRSITNFLGNRNAVSKVQDRYVKYVENNISAGPKSNYSNTVPPPLFSVVTHHHIITQRPLEFRPQSVQFDSRRLVCAGVGAKNEVAVFEDKNLFQLLGHDDSIHDMLLRNDTLVTCSSDKTIKIWDLQSKTCVNTLHGHCKRVNCVELLNANNNNYNLVESNTNNKNNDNDNDNNNNNQNEELTIVSGGMDNSICVWNSRQEVPVSVIEHAHNERVNDIRALPTQSSMVASVSDDGQIKIWDLNTNQMIDSWEVDPEGNRALGVYSVAIFGKIVATGGYSKKIKLWDLSTKQCIMNHAGHTASIYTLQLDNNKLLSGSADKTISMYDIRKIRGYAPTDTVFTARTFGSVFSAAFYLNVIAYADFGGAVVVLDYGQNAPIPCVQWSERPIKTYLG